MLPGLFNGPGSLARQLRLEGAPIVHAMLVKTTPPVPPSCVPERPPMGRTVHTLQFEGPIPVTHPRKKCRAVKTRGLNCGVAMQFSAVPWTAPAGRGVGWRIRRYRSTPALMRTHTCVALSWPCLRHRIRSRPRAYPLDRLAACRLAKPHMILERCSPMLRRPRCWGAVACDPPGRCP